MAIKTWKITIKLKSGTQQTTIQADTALKAKEMVEAQYGKGCILSGPTPVR
jgi:hypothetical protein